MSQFLSQIPSQVMRQEQRLTPQLIQSMDILQLPLAALEARINEELDRNPMLERVEHQTATPTEPGSHEPAVADPEAAAEAVAFNRLERMTREYDFDEGDRGYGRSYSGDGERDAKMDAMANTASRPISLQEHLLQQWALEEVDDETRRAGELIINFIDDDGWLHTDLVEIEAQACPTLAEGVLAEALRRVQTLEPTGVGARDLQECLLLQLDALPGDHELERVLVQEHLQDIQKNRYPVIARATGRSMEEVKDAVASLSKLHPQPGHLIVDREVPRIIPDVIVEYAEDGEGYTVRLARGNSPRLRLSAIYSKMLREQEGDKSDREFIRKNLESARALIDAITYRRDRLLELSKVVVERQREFFDRGPQALKILRMSALAEEFGCDPSTISRTVADKYMQTPRGIYPVRYFFTGGTESANGESTSWDSVRSRVQEIIENEDRKDPLSDDAVAARLESEGIKMSRRTIAKYRQQLNIPPARQRREY
ncbi:MAG: RNA polymerase factor sigma-54 [Phycisphaerae bacterium]|nr:RNA polymerase factor sigma-54 [Phycisphaerae bacterium]